jgi:hypothetical protein
MALFPVHAHKIEAIGLFKAHSTDFSGGEGGIVVELKADGVDMAVANIGASAADTDLHGLMDEQGELTTFGTKFGKFLAPNQAPVVIGPHTYLDSGRVSLWLQQGWFLCDSYSLSTDAYGEAATLAPGDLMYAQANDGTLTDVAGVATRVRFMKMIDDPTDLLATRVSPKPMTGMFAEKAPILIYQV